jgi:hypothetical protein
MAVGSLTSLDLIATRFQYPGFGRRLAGEARKTRPPLPLRGWKTEPVRRPADQSTIDRWRYPKM